MIVDPQASRDPWPVPARGDLALAASLLVVALLSGLFIDAARPDTIEPTAWWHWILICVPAVLVAFRRLDPIVVTGLATVAQAAIWMSNLPEVLLPMIVILYTAASEGGVRGRLVAVASSVILTVVTALGVAIADDVTAYQLPLVVLTCGTAIVLGTNAARQRAEAGELAAAVAESELRARHERSQAIADERSHIGRELHDIIGHSLSVIAVRAEAADRVADQRPEAARDAVADIAGAARSALSETRRILAGLRRASAAELAPPPDLAAVRRMIDDLAASGVDVTLSADGCDEHPPSAVVAGGVYRIVQESLTNAIKHGGPQVSVVIDLHCTPAQFDLTISSTGAAASGVETGGSGLTGMAERARVLGGSFTTERLAGGRFVVAASLPMGRTDVDEETER